MPDFIRLFVDHSHIGCGFRYFLVLHRGRKWARLLETSTLHTIDVPLAALAHAKPLPLPPRMASRLRARSKERRRLGLQYAPAAVSEALTQLKGDHK